MRVKNKKELAKSSMQTYQKTLSLSQTLFPLMYFSPQV